MARPSKKKCNLSGRWRIRFGPEQHAKGGAGKRPLCIGRGTGNAQGLSRLLDRQAGEVAQFDKLRRLPVLRAKPVESVVDGQELLGVGVVGDEVGIEGELVPPAA